MPRGTLAELVDEGCWGGLPKESLASRQTDESQTGWDLLQVSVRRWVDSWPPVLQMHETSHSGLRSLRKSLSRRIQWKVIITRILSRT